MSLHRKRQPKQAGKSRNIACAFQPALEALENRLTPATYNVLGTTADGVGFTVPTGPDTFNASTLRAAVVAANNNAGADIINVPAGNYDLTLAGDGLEIGDLDITDDVEIRGAGSTVTFIDATTLDNRLFDIFGGSTTVRIVGFTMGNAVHDNDTGGAIRNEGVLTLEDVNITNNVLNSGGNALGTIYNDGGELLLIASRITDNEVNADSGTNGDDAFGGAIYNDGGTITINGSVISGNSANGGNGSDDGGDAEGGALYNTNGGLIAISDSTLDGNEANAGNGGGNSADDDGGSAFGGAIRNANGDVHIFNSTLSNNEATGGNSGNGGDDGGIGAGGAVHNQGLLFVYNSTVSGNQATGGNGGTGGGDLGGNAVGGGIRNFTGGFTDIRNATITLNHAEDGNATISGTATGGGVADSTSTVNVISTIIAGNTSSDGNPDVEGTFNSDGFNVIGIAAAAAPFNGFDQVGDQVGTTGSPLDALLGPLQDNGGPTLTHLPGPGSPAIANGVNSLLLDFDQRGFLRETLGSTDVGAVQNQLINLDNVLGLYRDVVHGFYENVFGGGEKWLRGIANSFDNPWYFILPDGSFFEWDGSAGLNGAELGDLGADVYKNAELLFEASDLQLAPAEALLAEILDETRGLHVSVAGLFENFFGAGEKWLRGEVHAGGNFWYILLPNGDVFEWDGSNGATGSPLGNLGIAAYLKTELLFEAANDVIAGAAALDQAHGLYEPPTGFFQNLFGANEKWIRGLPNSFGNPWYFILPTGDVFEWDGTEGSLTGSPLGNFTPAAHLNPDLLYDAAAFVLPGAEQTQATTLDQQFGFYVDHRGLFQNFFGQGERWLRGVVNQFGTTWYFIKPDGKLFAWNGSLSASGAELFDFDAAVHIAPELISDAFKG